MNIPLSWLREAANIKNDTSNLLEKLTNCGNAVEGVVNFGADISGVVIGQITSLERHPDADKLWVTQANVGEKTIQIVTGAGNLQVGDYIPVALHNSTLANGLKIKNSKMRGLDSNGMLCSIDELGYTRADYPEAPEGGIYVFPDLDLEKYPLGSDARLPMQLLEDVADFDILSNRPDTNSIMGMAREAAAAYGHEFSPPEIKVAETGVGNANDSISVSIENPELCPRYIARMVTDVQIAPSPQWLRRRLSTAGVRPVNNIVDITNYVMLEYGQPLHAFDITAIAKDGAGKHSIIVKTATEGEKFTTLDGVERTLSGTTLVIADCEKPVAVAGVMGGETSKITDDTRTILFESACFDRANIRHTSRAMGLRTDASARYEKGQDPEIAITSVNRAMELVELLGCGKVVPDMVDAYPAPIPPRTMQLCPSAVCALLGVTERELSFETIRQYLHLVGFDVVEHFGHPEMARLGELAFQEITIPSWRTDVSCVACLAEEVARFYGLNNIPSRTVQLLDINNALPAAGKTPEKRFRERLGEIARALGFNEAITFPFQSPRVYDDLRLAPEARDGIEIKNPLNEDYSVMRHSLSSPAGLLECLTRNWKNANESALLYEIVKGYRHDESESFIEEDLLVLAGYAPGLGFLEFKGIIEELIAQLTSRPQEYKSGEVSYLHPGRAANALVRVSPNPRDEGMSVAWFGEVHPQTLEAYEIGTRAYVAVLGVNELAQLIAAKPAKFQPPYTLPPLTRDLAFKVKSDVQAAEIHSAIREKGGQNLVAAKLFDVYEGPQVGEGYKSVAYALTFRDRTRTLTVEDVAKPLENIIKNLEDKFQAEVRKS
jgi:phenylalanyl-tRNA synthetase beta chain